MGEDVDHRYAPAYFSAFKCTFGVLYIFFYLDKVAFTKVGCFVFVYSVIMRRPITKSELETRKQIKQSNLSEKKKKPNYVFYMHILSAISSHTELNPLNSQLSWINSTDVITGMQSHSIDFNAAQASTSF